MKFKGTLKQNIFFGIIFVIDIISLIPSPIFFMASIMSFADAPWDFSKPLEVLQRFSWLAIGLSPGLTVTCYVFGREKVVDENKKSGYVLAALSSVIAIAWIITFISVFVK